jgi:hypothetical protein
MNMKRGLVFSLCALALAAYGSTAMAQTLDVSLNLHYTDPNNPAAGGTFQLVGKVNSPGTTKGIAAVNAYLSGLNTTGLAYSAGTNSITNSGAVYQTAVTGGNNFLYGQDVSAGTVVLNVGNGTGTVGNQANDPLKSTAWNNSAVLITGTFGGARPAFITSGSNSSDGNLFTATATTTTPEAIGATVDANATFKVRGDSVSVDGLKKGDANRDWTVNNQDFNALALNFGGTGKTWDQGDFNSDGAVNNQDFNALALTFGQSSTPPSISSVPEPASLALIGIAAAGLCGAVRKRR